MPHLVIMYTGNLDASVEQGGGNIGVLCRSLANTMLAQRDEAGKQVFPTGGTRVLAYPAAHFAVADGGAAGLAAGFTQDGQGDYAFAYLNLRMGRGRSAELQQQIGQALLATAQAHFAPIFNQRPIGVTLQIDVGPEVFDAKHSNLHPLFNKA